MKAELTIFKHLLTKESYQRYADTVSSFVKNAPDLFLIFQALTSFFNKYDRDCSSVEELETHFLAQNVGLSPDQLEYYHAIFENIRSADVQPDVVQALLDSLFRRGKLVELAVASYEASEGRKDIEHVTALAAEISSPESQQEAAGTVFVTDDLVELHAKTVSAPGLRWRLKSLNQAMGSLRKGDFGFVFARPETGKTTFLASECTYMASQAASPILWFNNEEQGEKVMLRCYQAALGATLEQLFSSIERAKVRFQEVTGGRLKLLDQAILNRREVESICKAVQPSLIVFDQIDKVTGFAADRDDLVLGAIYQWARELAKTYCPVIGVCQADGTAEGVKWLTMAHVANAKTSKQAEADWILGIGRSNDAGYEEVRHFNVSKNKLVGDKDSLPDMRHGKWDVLIQPMSARYKDIVA